MARAFSNEPGQVLFSQEQPSDGLYLIERGEVEVTARIPGDETVTLARMGAGELLGELSLLDRGRRSGNRNAARGDLWLPHQSAAL